MVKAFKVFCPSTESKCKYRTCKYKTMYSFDDAYAAQKHHLRTSSLHYMDEKDAEDLMAKHPDYIVEESDEETRPKPSINSSLAASASQTGVTQQHVVPQTPRQLGPRAPPVVSRTFQIPEAGLVKLVQTLIRAETAARSASRVAAGASRNFSDEAEVLVDARRQVEGLMISLGSGVVD